MRCGWAKQLASGGIVFGTINCKPNPKDDFAARRLRLYRSGLADVLTPDVTGIVFESVQFFVSTAQSRWWGAWWGLTLLAADAREIPCHGVPVSTLKLWATGDGRAPKNDMQDAAARYVDDPTTSDEADAILLLAYAMELTSGERTVVERCGAKR